MYCNLSLLTYLIPGPVAQSAASPNADPSGTSLIPAWFHTLGEIDHEIIPPADLRRVIVSYK